MSQVLVPIADSSGVFNNTWWNPQPQYPELNEGAAPNDADYVFIFDNPNPLNNAFIFACQLTTATDPGIDTGHQFSFRFSYDLTSVASGKILEVLTYLYQGDPVDFSSGTYITDSEFGVNGFPIQNLTGSAGFTTYTYTLDSTEAALITDYSDLWLVFQVNSQSQAGVTDLDPNVHPAAYIHVSWLEMEVPNAANICTWWKINGPGGDDGPFGHWFQEACSPGGTTPPDDISFNFDFFWDGIFYPAGTTFHWTSTAAPDNTGWWSSDVDFQGAATLLDNARPKDLRSFTEITAFANGSAGTMGGFPGPACQFGNRMVYAPGGYTVGTDLPTIRNFDGVSDREVASLPKTSSGGIPKGIMTMLSANGTVYLTTLDSGTTAANFAGRVFQLDMASGNLTQIGSAFSSGQLPYTLAWHNGRLWMGTNSGDPATTVGKVYYMRQDGVDSDWTIENTLTAACATSMVSYKGRLFIGCSATAGNFAKVLVRGVDNAYTTSETGSGGTARANNFWPAITVFGENLYASYWNPDTGGTKYSSIHKYDNSTWSTVYSQTNDGIQKPWLAFPIDETTMLALAGGLTYTAALILTENGTSWTDRTVFLTQSTTASTGLPGWAIVVR